MTFIYTDPVMHESEITAGLNGRAEFHKTDPQAMISETWETDSDTDSGLSEEDIASESDVNKAAADSNTLTGNIIVRWLILLLLNWQSAFTVSAQGMSKLLVVIKRILMITATAATSPIVAFVASIFPGSLYMAFKYLAVQLMRRFQNEQELSNSIPPTEYSHELQDSLHTLQSKKAHISVLTNSEQQKELLLHASLFTHTTKKWPYNSI